MYFAKICLNFSIFLLNLLKQMQKSTFKDFLKDNWVWLTLGGVTLAGAYLLKKRYHAKYVVSFGV